MHLKCRIVAALGGDHQRFSVECSNILDLESWVAQIESHKEENISEAKMRGERERERGNAAEEREERKREKERDETERS